MNYGLTYIGSKNSIAKEIVDILPSATNFYDVFCGGGAITHCAMLKEKYKNYHMIDNNSIIDLFYDAIRGKYKDENRWISRENFHKNKDWDAFIKYVWSFNSEGLTYLYSREIEEWKKAIHFALFYDDYTRLERWI